MSFQYIKNKNEADHKLIKKVIIEFLESSAFLEVLIILLFLDGGGGSALFYIESSCSIAGDIKKAWIGPKDLVSTLIKLYSAAYFLDRFLRLVYN
jgi:hypothetical protein